ncbi:NAD(P)H-dependent oxidoreductase subunit E [bacterium]|nr:NAD(P)H-dependent oxidoreductase subunit E [bacterium]
MEKLVVKVCLGTTCFVMGGSNLQELSELVPQKYGDKVEVTGSPCLGLCSIKMEYAKAPYVKVGNEVVEDATVEKVIAAIEKHINNKN